MQDRDPDHFVKSQTVATWVSAISAFVAIPLALFAIWQSHRAVISSTREDLLVQVKHRPDLYTVSLTPTAFPEMPFLMNTTWEVVVANNGDRTLSLVEYEVKHHYLLYPGFYTDAWYTGISAGLTGPDGRTPVTLPLNVEPGKGMAFCVVIGAVVGRRAGAALQTHLDKTQQPLILAEAERVAVQVGVDIYDNPARRMDTVGPIDAWVWTGAHKEQHFILTIRTARGTGISKTIIWPQKVLPPPA